MGGVRFLVFLFSKEKVIFWAPKDFKSSKTRDDFKKIIIKCFLLFLRPSDRANIGLK